MAEPSLHPRWRAVHNIEPLPAEGGALEGEGRMGRDEERAGQGFRPDRGQINQVKAIRTHAMQQQDQRIGLAA